MKLLFTFILSCASLLSSFAQAQQAQPTLPVKPINIGMHIVQAEIASNESQREQGLMFRRSMDDNHGMLFIFDQPAGICMWMKNTLIPLSVAFIDAKGKIINIEDMKPQTLDAHCAFGAAKYALEMNLNWFKQKHIEPGMTISGIK